MSYSNESKQWILAGTYGGIILADDFTVVQPVLRTTKKKPQNKTNKKNDQRSQPKRCQKGKLPLGVLLLLSL